MDYCTCDFGVFSLKPLTANPAAQMSQPQLLYKVIEIPNVLLKRKASEKVLVSLPRRADLSKLGHWRKNLINTLNVRALCCHWINVCRLTIKPSKRKPQDTFLILIEPLLTCIVWNVNGQPYDKAKVEKPGVMIPGADLSGFFRVRASLKSTFSWKNLNETNIWNNSFKLLSDEWTCLFSEAPLFVLSIPRELEDPLPQIIPLAFVFMLLIFKINLFC